MKKTFVFSILVLFFVTLSLQSFSQNVTTSNVQSYVKSCDYQHTHDIYDDCKVYKVKFTDNTVGYIHYDSDNGHYYDGCGVMKGWIGDNKNEALVWLWKKLH